MKNNLDLDGKTSLARDLRALRNINITDRVFGRGHHLCRANRIGGQFRASAFTGQCQSLPLTHPRSGGCELTVDRQGLTQPPQHWRYAAEEIYDAYMQDRNTKSGSSRTRLSTQERACREYARWQVQ